PADVPEQELDDRRGADVLDADRVLRPADRVDDRRRALAARARAQRLGDLEELLLGASADLRDELGRVAAEVLPDELEDAARVLERRVLLGRLTRREVPGLRAVAGLLALRAALRALARRLLDGHAGVVPARRVVDPRLGVEAGEEPVGVLRVPGRFEPRIRLPSEWARPCWQPVAPPRPNEVPRPGTVEECHMRAWFSTWTMPRPMHSFLIR